FELTDQAAVTLEVADPADGRTLARRSIGTLGAGVHDVLLLPADLAGDGGGTDRVLRLAAASSYGNGATDVAHASFRADPGTASALPSRPVLVGNWPNPARPSTRISFLLPPASGERVTLDVFDAAGRRVRRFERAFTPGVNAVDWDGTDDRGVGVKAGLYFYRLDVGRQSLTRSMALVR
ncbi:MAG TPA: FlgD immunoglobulin-like domain containing protein, partial [Candidatus Eisenbacteria bacterium]